MSRSPSSEPTGRDNGYFRAKVAQEKLIEASGIPYTIIRSTQFLEFLAGIADSSTDGNIVRLSPGLFQPIAADDVAANVADVALAAPRNGIVEIAGPERVPFNEIVARYLKAVGDPRAGRERSSGPILGRPGRGTLAGAVGRGPPGPHWSRRMAPPLGQQPDPASANRKIPPCNASSVRCLSPHCGSGLVSLKAASGIGSSTMPTEKSQSADKGAPSSVAASSDRASQREGARSRQSPECGAFGTE